MLLIAAIKRLPDKAIEGGEVWVRYKSDGYAFGIVL
jgi:hypothetical protein